MTRQTSDKDNVNDPQEKIDAFSKRMDVAIRRAGGATLMAGKAGVSGSVLRKWRAGQSEPSLSRLVSMANAAGVSVQWLATGEGPIEPMTEEDGPALDNEARPGKGPERRAETRMEGRDEIREIESPTDTVKDEMGSYPLEEEPIYEIQGASIAPFIPELSDVLVDPARRHAAGAEQEKDKRLWITMKAYSVLWELYQRNVDALVDLTEEDVEPIVEGIARAYDNLLGQWGEG